MYNVSGHSDHDLRVHVDEVSDWGGVGGGGGVGWGVGARGPG